MRCSPLRLVSLLAGGAVLWAAPLAAQNHDCPADTTAGGRICQARVDPLTRFLPTENVLVSGGNIVPGTAGAIGKFGHFRIGARVGLVRITIPSTSYDGTSDTVKADTRMLIPVPRFDLSVGLFSKKLPMGSVAVDLLGSAVVLPTNGSSRYQVDENTRTIDDIALGLGFGFRAAFQIAGNKPTISLSVMKRDMPTLRFGDLGAGDDLHRDLAQLHQCAPRGRRRLSIMKLTGGAGMDLIKGNGTVTYRDSAATPTDSTLVLPLSTSRITTFLNAALMSGPSLCGAKGASPSARMTGL